MEIVSNREETIYRKDYNGKPSYSILLSKRNKDTGEYSNGFMKVNFRKGTDIKNKSKIRINNAWLDFYKENDKTIPTIFISEYEVTLDGEEPREVVDPFGYMKQKIESDIGEQIKITDDDLPF